MSPRALTPLQPAATPAAQIRNFCIIAHIDHGKSTLADRMLQITGVVAERDMRAQYLDRMDIERERGITIKSQAVRMPWALGQAQGPDEVFALNMIDTPGHNDLHIIPVLNKIDLPAADPEKYAKELASLIGGKPEDVLRVSGKTGMGVEDLLDRIVEEIPAPVGDADAPARAMIFDSVYDAYRGVVTYVRMVDGSLSPRERIQMMSTGANHEALEVGVDYAELREALDKLKLSDASLQYEPETSVALGFGFRCGFLGLLHLEIVTERLSREFGLDLITTAPSVIYEVVTSDTGET
ncbi:unnamed protein product, partial [Penicillium discolor]